MNVRVYNDNQFEHVEKFRGDTIRIPAGGFIEMNREDAVLFRGQFFQPKYDSGNKQLIESMKMIRIAPIGSGKTVTEDLEADEHKCMKCSFVAKSKAGLTAHIRHNHQDAMLDDDARQEIAKG